MDDRKESPVSGKKPLRSILITGFHSTNMGDAAILHSMLLQIREAFPKASITVHCSDPEAAARAVIADGVAFRHSLIPTYDHDASPPGARQFIGVPVMIARNLIRAIAYRIFGRRPSACIAGKREPMDDFLCADIVVSMGGGYISDDYGYVRPYSDFLTAKLAGKRLALYAHSIGPFGGWISRALSRLILSGADLIILRERGSLRNLESIGVHGAHVTADAAFALPSPNRARRSRKALICVREWTYRHRAQRERYLSFIEKLVDALAGKGYAAEFLPTTPDDVRFHRRHLAHLKGKASFVKSAEPPIEIARRLSTAAFLVSSRMHPIVLGSLSSTPFFAIGWEFKLEEISGMLAGGSCNAHASELDDSVISAILSCVERREELAHAISSQVPIVRAKAGKSIGLLAGSAASWGYSAD
ncbi:polysaccharide pyruvyl transferase family protein [Candidatus Micrarchaeota archaeon]|nr:polysaccharide pyruvyl transferase family protein [Candidatus Micrarchaeota archaeon]